MMYDLKKKQKKDHISRWQENAQTVKKDKLKNANSYTIT